MDIYLLKCKKPRRIAGEQRRNEKLYIQASNIYSSLKNRSVATLRKLSHAREVLLLLAVPHRRPGSSIGRVSLRSVVHGNLDVGVINRVSFGGNVPRPHLAWEVHAVAAIIPRAQARSAPSQEVSSHIRSVSCLFNVLKRPSVFQFPGLRAAYRVAGHKSCGSRRT